MTLEEFLDRHQLVAIPADQPFPEELCPHESKDEDEYRFFVNREGTIGLGLNESKEEVRVVYAELGVADTGWIPRAEASAVTGFDYTTPEKASQPNEGESRNAGGKDPGR